MKNLSILLGLLLALSQPPLLAQTKRALVIAIGNYPQQTGWQVISSSNDITLIEPVLHAQQFTDVVTLSDERADRAGIVSALRALIACAGRGDKTLIHFSSHGQQITDQNADETDAYDEAIVCYGAPQFATGRFADYTGDQHLRDEDLGVLINELRAKLGSDGDVLLIVDACHSGTITRGSARVRGTNKPMQIPKAQFAVQKGHKQAQPRPFMAGSRPVSQSGLAPYVVISASRANESNFECYLPDNKTSVGSLSFALNQALMAPRRGESYRDLFSRVQSIMRQKVPAQTPEIEGDVDRELFGGKAVAQDPFFTLTDLQDEGRQATINTGQMTETFVGSVLNVCPADTRNLQTCTAPIASATVVQAGLYTATIQLDTPVRPERMKDYRVFTKERSSGSLVVAVGLAMQADRRGSAFREQATAELRKQRLVSLDGRPEVIVFQDSANPAKVGIRSADNGFVFAEPIEIQTATDWQRVVQSLQRYAQSQFLLRLNVNGYDMDVTMELVPLKPDAKNPSDTTNRAAFMDGSWLTFSHTDRERATLKLTNRSRTRTIYYNVIDIQPDGVVNMIIPQMKDGKPIGESPSQLVISPNTTILAPVIISFYPPYGNETFKLFATAEPIDLRMVVGVAKKRSETRGSMGSLIGLFDDTNEMLEKGASTRGGGANPIPEDGSVTTRSVQFKIIDRRK